MQKTNRLQRLLAVVVAVFMVICCLPLNAFAEDANAASSDVTTQSEAVASQSEAAAPQSEAVASQSEAAAPQSEAAASQSEATAPQSEAAASQSEAVASQSEAAAPQSEAAAPQSEAAAPQSEAAAPQSEAAAPQSEAPSAVSEAKKPESGPLDWNTLVTFTFKENGKTVKPSSSAQYVVKLGELSHTYKFSDIKGVPEGYSIVHPEKTFTVHLFQPKKCVVVEVEKNTKKVTVSYWDVENNKQAKEETVTVDKDADSVNTSDLTVPEGYEFVKEGEMPIRDGNVYVEVKPIATTQEIGVNYWDVENNEPAGEGKVTVAADATKVNTGDLTDIPEGYELVNTGDVQINGGWIYVEVKPIATTQEIGVNYWDVENNEPAGEGKVTVAADATNVNTGDLTDIPEGYELVNTGDVQINGGWIYVEVKPVATTQEVGVNYWDVENNEPAGEGKVTVAADATNVNTGDLTDIPEGYELVNTGDVQINGGWIYVEVKPVATTQEVGVNYWDIENNEQVYEGKVTVAADATNVNTGDLTDIPEGYELVNTGDVRINDGWIYVEVKPVATTQEVGVNYWDIENNEQVYEGKVTVAADATNVNTGDLTDIPEGYELVNTGDVRINDGWIYVEVKPVATTQEVGVNYWDIENNEQVYEGKVTVAADATNVNTGDLTDIPEGYELVNTGDIRINDGWIYVEVKPVATTQEVGVNYWDIENNEQVYEGKVTVAADATNVNTGDLTDIPEGYELVNTGDIRINDGWIYVEVKPVATTKTIGLNYYDEENGRQVKETMVEVALDAISISTNDIELPDGYEFTETGDLLIRDGWVYVGVKPVEGTRVVGLNYYDEVNQVQVCEKELVVDADAIHVNTNDIPALDGYEFIVTGDLAINDGWVYVGVKPLETKTVGLNFYDEENHEQVCERQVEVPYDAIHMNTSEIELPDGYEFTVTGDLAINDNWIYVGVKCVKTLRIYWAVDNKDASFVNGNEDAWTQELTWKHVNDDITMPEVNVPDGYVLNGWSVSGREGEFWKASLKTVKVGDKYVADKDGGIISITANIVTEEQSEGGNTGSNDNTNNSNTTTATVTSTNNNTTNNTQVVKAEAPADNTAKVMPQTGLTAEAPVVFGVMMFAALAGAGAYLFAIRKKLN